MSQQLGCSFERTIFSILAIYFELHPCLPQCSLTPYKWAGLVRSLPGGRKSSQAGRQAAAGPAAPLRPLRVSWGPSMEEGTGCRPHLRRKVVHLHSLGEDAPLRWIVALRVTALLCSPPKGKTPEFDFPPGYLSTSGPLVRFYGAPAAGRGAGSSCRFDS